MTKIHSAKLYSMLQSIFAIAVKVDAMI